MSNLGPVNDSQRRLREDLWARHLPYKKKAQKEQSVNQPHLGHKLILNWGWGNTGFTFPLFEMESSRTNGKKEGVGDWPPYRGVNKWDNECENEVSQLCPTLCDPMDCSLHGISSGQMQICGRSVTFHKTFIWSPHITHEYLCEQAFCILTVTYFIAQPIRMNCSTCIEICFVLF